jgi:hypothetical protein
MPTGKRGGYVRKFADGGTTYQAPLSASQINTTQGTPSSVASDPTNVSSLTSVSPPVPTDNLSSLPAASPVYSSGLTPTPTIGDTPTSPTVPAPAPVPLFAPRGGLNGTNVYENQNKYNNPFIPNDKQFDEMMPRNMYDNAHIRPSVDHQDNPNDDYIHRFEHGNQQWNNPNMNQPSGQMGINGSPNQGNFGTPSGINPSGLTNTLRNSNQRRFGDR